MLLVVVADTHLRERFADQLPTELRHAIAQADLVLHAGDIVSAAALAELQTMAPTRAVLGNNDLELVDELPECLQLELEGVRIAMVHDAGERRGRAERAARRFPDADLVVFGHSHVPLNTEGVGGQGLFNPGSPTQRRGQPRASFGVIEVQEAAITARRLELL